MEVSEKSMEEEDMVELICISGLKSDKSTSEELEQLK